MQAMQAVQQAAQTEWLVGLRAFDGAMAVVAVRVMLMAMIMAVAVATLIMVAVAVLGRKSNSANAETSTQGWTQVARLAANVAPAGSKGKVVAEGWKGVQAAAAKAMSVTITMEDTMVVTCLKDRLGMG
mmetsp:Transcript_6305/g.10657  ORF Transcript_6305/g.10657 Transcript_6305/m.10657 type:complete len:129 (-) Transcript_6305:55-441(-)